MLGVGGGTYYLVGRPHLAQRDASGLNTREVSGLVPFLIQRVRQYPGDARAWRYLGQAYMAAKDPRDAAKALAKVIALTGKGDAALDAAYGEALVLANDGAVPPEAEAAFTAALRADPGNAPARFYLGLAKAAHNDRAGAIALWQSLLADTPVTAPLHQMLVDRIAILTSQSVGPGGAPNPRAMVDMLAARLKADPNDALGWVRLMRAYTVLGETEKGQAGTGQRPQGLCRQCRRPDRVQHRGEGAEAQLSPIVMPAGPASNHQRRRLLAWIPALRAHGELGQ